MDNREPIFKRFNDFKSQLSDHDKEQFEKDLEWVATGNSKTSPEDVQLTRQDVMCRLVRLRLNTSQKDMAKRLHISESYLSDMLLGKREWTDGLLELIGVERAIVFYGEKGWKP